MKTQTLYQEAIKFATAKHLDQDQKVPGTNLPYIVHLSNVAMEIMIASLNTDSFNLELAVQVALLHDTLEDTSTDFAELAVQVALLHDTLEDTSTDFAELESKFGIEVATAVSALTKNSDLSKEQSMVDSLARIKEMPSEVWAVKLADRITNLQPPPARWDNGRKIAYRGEAMLILNELKEGNEYLASRLQSKIEEYQIYITN